MGWSDEEAVLFVILEVNLTFFIQSMCKRKRGRGVSVFVIFRTGFLNLSIIEPENYSLGTGVLSYAL